MSFIPRFSCPRRWQDMPGDERQRFCEHCQSHVHNLDALSADQRIKLLYGEGRHICGRYRVAVRRASPGYEEPYMRHLLKYGAGVAAASGALITLWQLYDPAAATPMKDYLVTHPCADQLEMPREFMFETETLIAGGICGYPIPNKPYNPSIELPEISSVPVKLVLDPNDLKSLEPMLEKIEIPSPQIERSLPKSPISRARGNHTAGGSST